jgi:hypothetical protein
VNVGALKALLSTLQASSFLSGVNVLFGEEELDDESKGTPKVVIVPDGGQWESPGYIKGVDPETVNIWETKEECEVYCIAFSATPNAQPIDHADEVESLRQLVLAAFQDQRNQANADGSSAPGIYWKPLSGRWEKRQNALNRMGRAYVFRMLADISVPMPAPSGQVTVTSETINQTITSPQHVS